VLTADRRADFLRSGHLQIAHGEEDLLAYYAVRTNAEGRHDFVPPDGGTWADAGPINLDGSHFAGMISDPRYAAKKRADKISYAWDTLIETFTGHMLGGTSIVLPGFEYSLTESEVAFRYMALQSRLDRRGLSEALLGALKLGEFREIFFRAVLSPEVGPVGTGFFFLTVKYQNWMDSQGGYDRYRLFRTGYGEVYAMALLMKHPTLERVIGIAAEPPKQGRGSSEDCIYVAQRDWTEEERSRNRADCEKLRIMGSLRTSRFHQEEYPSIKSSRPSGIEGPHEGTNRRERRARAAMRRKSR
jgi:hypothetical protein